MLQIRWLGRGGQGCFTATRLLGLAAMIQGQYALAFPSFGPERRGAPVLGFTKISNDPVRDRSAIQNPDVVVVLDAAMLTPNAYAGLKENGFLLVNSPTPVEVKGNFITRSFDATAWAIEILGRPVANTAMLGVLIANTGCVFLEVAEQAVAKEFEGKLQEKNIELLRLSFQRALPYERLKV
ncbi:MAG: 2-oxoacid:acceptor oxidoreductase family protein [Fibrobacteraceae bacterium]|nr:MAG: hypothetical protein AUK31_02840 [Fibrobacteres bacterium CG2_30_45_31]